VPEWVSEARAGGYSVEHEGKYWRMTGALYDDQGDQVGN
jgi:membrane protein implicated in regulation of membrane protease activity